MPSLDQEAAYVIKIQGRIDSNLVDRFGPVSIASAVEDEGRTITTLSGIATDQAGLVGLIRHLHGLGVVLLSIERATSR